MTIRQRQATGSATAAIADGTDAGLDRSTHFSWEDWFLHAGAQQRAEALGLAREQGVLYPHQLPAVSNGVKPSTISMPVPETAAAAALSQSLAGHVGPSAAPTSESLSFFDPALDDVQRQAVTRAVGAPDLFMLQGLPGTGKSRVVAEIIRQAAARGWRVLFLAGHAASIDVVLERLTDSPEILALRYCEAGEKADAIPASLRALTLEHQQKSFIDRALVAARTNYERAELACRQRRNAEPVWEDLSRLLRHAQDVDNRLQAVTAELSTLRQAVERDAEGPLPFAVRLAELRRAHDQAMQKLEGSLRTERNAAAQCDEELAQLAAGIAQRDSAYRAKKHGKFWSPAYWLNLFNGRVIEEMETLLVEQATAQARRQEIAQWVARIESDQKQAHDHFVDERDALLAAETSEREHILVQQRQAMEEERSRLDHAWRSACDRLASGELEKTQAALEAAEQAWLQQKKADEQQCEFTQHLSTFVEQHGPRLAAKLPAIANVVATLLSRWHADARLRDTVSGPFDLLIAEDADALTESDVRKLARQAGRCVLVGEALAEEVPPTTAAGPVTSAFWHRLWQALGGEANRWPSTWQRDNGRLVCRLFPLSADDCRHLESEGLADSPDIELGILHHPQTRPCLAQVAFAPQCNFGDAFRFMMREVQEFPLQPVGRTAWWSETAHHHRRHFGCGAGSVHTWIECEPGVKLGAVSNEHGDAARIACIEFEKAGGWDRSKAEAWLKRHRPAHDAERTAFLQIPHRFCTSLSALVRTVIRADDWPGLSAPAPVEQAPAYEFIAVPPIDRPDWPREGAGLELDLTAPRHAERLPAGLRHGLPPRGFVNYLEAQALIRRLEKWTRENPAATAQVAVLALFEGQVELLRRLIEQSEILRGRAFPLEAALPSRMHQRECDVVFLSLTRSHAHRATAFGEDARELPLALTRSRSRLFVFGDPGALNKRVSTAGPLERLDAHAAEQELVRLSRLVSHLQQHAHAGPRSNGSVNGKD